VVVLSCFVMCRCELCNVWVCVCVGVLVICVLIFPVFRIVCTLFLYCFIYVYFFFVTSLWTTATE